MKSALIGYTGFVGSNLAEQFDFTDKYNSKNIEQAFDTNPDLLVYAGIRSEKFLANKNQNADMLLIQQAIENIRRINAKKVVLISTIDVYKNPVDVDEMDVVDTKDLLPYGADRYYLEQKVREDCQNSLIMRLPGLYGKGIKKNFIYDFIHVIPNLLSYEKFKDLVERNSTLNNYYTVQDNGFYKCIASNTDEKKELRSILQKLEFTALNFTDSCGKFQFYPLSRLWRDMELALKNDIDLLNLATEPIIISNLYEYLTGKQFNNIVTKEIPNYDFRTIHSNLYDGQNGYICNQQDILKDIKQFIQEQKV